MYLWPYCMWKNNSWCLYFSIHVFFIFLLSGFFGDQLWPPKQSWALHSSYWSFWSLWKKGIYSNMCSGWILILGGLAFCARSWLSIFFFSIWRIFKTHHITSNVQNWIDLKHSFPTAKLNRVKLHVACELKQMVNLKVQVTVGRCHLTRKCKLNYAWFCNLLLKYLCIFIVSHSLVSIFLILIHFLLTSC